MAIRLQWLPGAPSEAARLRYKETCFLPAENGIGQDQTDAIQKSFSVAKPKEPCLGSVDGEPSLITVLFA